MKPFPNKVIVRPKAQKTKNWFERNPSLSMTIANFTIILCAVVSFCLSSYYSKKSLELATRQYDDARMQNNEDLVRYKAQILKDSVQIAVTRAQLLAYQQIAEATDKQYLAQAELNNAQELRDKPQIFLHKVEYQEIDSSNCKFAMVIGNEGKRAAFVKGVSLFAWNIETDEHFVSNHPNDVELNPDKQMFIETNQRLDFALDVNTVFYLKVFYTDGRNVLRSTEIYRTLSPGRFQIIMRTIPDHKKSVFQAVMRKKLARYVEFLKNPDFTEDPYKK